jgi:iron complex outermembrane recepter protein
VSYVESVAPPTIGVAPERGEQYELGIKYQPFGTNALVSASVYDLTRNDITVPVVLGNGTIERQLIGESRVRGLEIEGKAELVNNLNVIAAYTYMKSEVLRSAPVRGVNVEGNEFGSTPNHLASIWLNYVLPGSGNRGEMSFSVGARYTGSYYYTLQNNNGKSESAIILDAVFGYEVAENTQFAINISNLFDEQHVLGRGTADYYNPGREIAATLRRTW